LWEYQPVGFTHGESATYRLGALCVASKNLQDQTSTFLIASIPHSAALDEMNRLPPADELLVVKRSKLT
jgi:hypothetical protein